jgi:hypothetical protein
LLWLLSSLVWQETKNERLKIRVNRCFIFKLMPTV